MDFAHPTIDSEPALRRNAKGSDAKARTETPHELEVRHRCAREDRVTVVGYATIGGEVAGEPSVQIGRVLVEIWQLFEVGREVRDCDPAVSFVGVAEREPLD